MASSARIFIGSSTEGRDIARNLQAELGSTLEVDRWDQSVFEPSGYVLDSLADVASRVDFAVLVATPDDVTLSRGRKSSSIRDNIVLEFGFFVGALGRQRTYLLATGAPELPSDLAGLTRLSYVPRTDGNLRASVSDAALQIEQRARELGPRRRARQDEPTTIGLDAEIDRLCLNASQQGWQVRSNSTTTLRLRSPHGTVHTLSKTRPEDTRERLRSFVKELRGQGLRVNSGLRRPVADSPF